MVSICLPIFNSPISFPSLWGSFQVRHLQMVSPSVSYSTVFLVLWQGLSTCLSFLFSVILTLRSSGTANFTLKLVIPDEFFIPVSAVFFSWVWVIVNILRSIADLNNNMVCIVSIHSLISNFSSFFSKIIIILILLNFQFYFWILKILHFVFIQDLKWGKLMIICILLCFFAVFLGDIFQSQW